jgi:hypothetical protein
MVVAAAAAAEKGILHVGVIHAVWFVQHAVLPFSTDHQQQQQPAQSYPCFVTSAAVAGAAQREQT